MSLGGKRLRPLLTLLGASFFTDNWQIFTKPAIAVEVFHNFTLMHDDIMDKAPLRRGKPTVHEKWNANIAILSGDVMLVQAYELLTDIDPAKLPQVLRAFNRCAAEVCEGQQIDMNFETRNDVSEDEYLDMIRLKTAVLLGFSLKLGGILGGTSEANLTLLKELGENIGIGFQLKDDLLDVFGDQAKFGKQVGGDIIANKKTFLLIEALTQATGQTAKDLNHWLSLKDFDKAEKVAAVTEIYNKLNIKTLTENKINQYFEKGFDCLKKIEAPAEKKFYLQDFIEKLMQREH
ncbi:MAG: polyprenyl synthetase family protein [Verrucomicrobia bacterium]|nr:polyprenyl synthetase family protein [Cytophagales bacterium]